MRFWRALSIVLALAMFYVAAVLLFRWMQGGP